MTRRTKTFLHVMLWAVSVILIIIVGLIYFPRESPGIGYIQAFYYTLRLFFLNNSLPFFPKAPLLIFIYFFSPAITISAIGTTLNYLFRITPTMRVFWMSDHVIVCGVGRNGKLIATTLKKKGLKVVGVDSGCPEDYEDWIGENKIPIIFGSFYSEAILRRAGARRARSIIFASGSDTVNMDGAMEIYEFFQKTSEVPKIIWAHIADGKLANIARIALLPRYPVSIRYFDTYWIASEKMVATHLNRQKRRNVSEIYIIGLGKFGRALAEILFRNQGTEESWIIHIIDSRDMENDVKTLAEENNVPGRVTFTQTCIQDMKTAGGEDKVYFLCTDDDIGNLTLALMLSNQMEPTRLFVRMKTLPTSGIADHLGKDKNIIFININELLIDGIENLVGVFSPARLTDFKRVKDAPQN